MPQKAYGEILCVVHLTDVPTTVNGFMLSDPTCEFTDSQLIAQYPIIHIPGNVTDVPALFTADVSRARHRSTTRGHYTDYECGHDSAHTPSSHLPQLAFAREIR
ncbi:hypothetical protein DO944_00450 [Microbacterium sp. SMR1]|nr:hypothetical protein DO944_00450 [Microbacterium sp. SMR1]